MYWNAMPAGGLGFGITTGTFSGPVKPLIEVDEVAGLDDRAHARDLVDLDG